MNFNVPVAGITALIIITLCMYAYINGNAHAEEVKNLFSIYEKPFGKLSLFFIPMFLVSVPLLLSCLIPIVIRQKLASVPSAVQFLSGTGLYYIIAELICMLFLFILQKAILSKPVYGSKETDDAVIEFNIAIACLFVIIICLLVCDFEGAVMTGVLLLGHFMWFGKVGGLNVIPVGLKAQKVRFTILCSILSIALYAASLWGASILYQNINLYFGIYFGLLAGAGISLIFIILLELYKWLKSKKVK